MIKYQPLATHLAAAVGDRLTLSFAQVERILGCALPPTARKQRQWWKNDAPPWGTWLGQAESWLTAGWKVESVDLGAEVVTFSRV